MIVVKYYLCCMTGYDKYIIPVFNTNYSEGVGFFVHDFLITAGHVVREGQPFIFMNGKKHFLEITDALLLRTLNEESTYDDGMDIAVFFFEGMMSPLTFSRTCINVGSQLTSRSMFRHYSEDFGDELSVEETSGQVTEVMGNFFKCDLERTLREGSSGSPIFCDNEVVGILYGNDRNDPENRILYLSGCAINELLRQIRR